MIEQQRQARNGEKLAECHPGFREPLRRVLASMERQGFRPRVQEAWRSPADQQRAYETGHSRLRYGLHNATGDGGGKEALAADVLDDDHPNSPPVRYLLALAVAARDVGLETGVLWGLDDAQRARTDAAIRARNINAKVRVGWDPTHAQARGISAAQAKAGVRPAIPTSQEDDDMTPDEMTNIVRREIAAGLRALTEGGNQRFDAEEGTTGPDGAIRRGIGKSKGIFARVLAAVGQSGGGFGDLSDDDLAAIAKAVNDESARRQQS